jgi:Bifunctional DNA primase/polymerase, N-terminal
MSPLETALEYISRGWAPVPIPHKSKRPIGDEWQKLRITETDARQWFNGEEQNIGVRLGGLSDGLADVDLDTTEAGRAAPYFLPRTLCFGRPSKPRSHSRNLLSEALIADLYEDWLKHGMAAIRKVREERPADYLKVVALLVSKCEDLGADVSRNAELLQVIEERRQKAAAQIAKMREPDDA